MTKSHRRLTTILRVLSTVLMLMPAISLFLAHPARASDFEIAISRSFEVADDLESVRIREKRAITNNSSDFFIPSTSSEKFTIQNFKEGFTEDELESKMESLKVTNGYGKDLTYNLTNEDDNLIVEVDFPGALTYSSTQIFQIEYDSIELIENVGNLTNIYIPGLDSEYEKTSIDDETGTSTTITYTTTLAVPKSLGDASFTLPTPTSTRDSAGNTIYTFSTQSILGTTVWHQIGTEQTYHFRLYQPLSATDDSTPGAFTFLTKNQYNLVLPRDYGETNQEVYFTDLEPQPDDIHIDEDGNLIATFYTDATQNSAISIEGYVRVSLNTSTEDLSQSNATLDDITDSSDMERYLQPAEYWESDHPDIIKKAKELADGSTNVMEILRADYKFIIDSIDYDDFKYGELNSRKGALETLHGENSVCMEYSDLFIALARAQGIPARAAYGYGYDPKYPPDQQEDHQWVQAWVPDYGWLSIDPTWGETGREFIGRDLDHALWYVSSEHPNVPSPFEIITASSDVVLEDSVIEITAVEGIPMEITGRSANDLISEIGEDTSSVYTLSRTIQTSVLGKSLVTLLPFCGIMLAVTVVGFILVKAFANIAKKRKVVKEMRSRNNPGIEKDTTEPKNETASAPVNTQ